MALKSINLTGEQKKVLFLPATNPIQIKGVAGSGKTTIAMYRAKHLVETYSDLFREADIMVFTFNKSLTQYIQSLLPYVIGGYDQDSGLRKSSSKGLSVRVSTFHKWAFDYLKQHGVFNEFRQMEKAEAKQLIAQAIDRAKKLNTDSRILYKPIAFFEEEISWIQGRMMEQFEEYNSTRRIGRGTKDRVDKNDKKLIWEVLGNYQVLKDEKRLLDFDDYARLCWCYLEESGDSFYSHIIVDEAQDLNMAQMSVISFLVRSETNSITIIADTAQRIYKKDLCIMQRQNVYRWECIPKLVENIENTQYCP